jgi:hypothetical protein
MSFGRQNAMGLLSWAAKSEAGASTLAAYPRSPYGTSRRLALRPGPSAIYESGHEGASYDDAPTSAALGQNRHLSGVSATDGLSLTADAPLQRSELAKSARR